MPSIPVVKPSFTTRFSRMARSWKINSTKERKWIDSQKKRANRGAEKIGAQAAQNASRIIENVVIKNSDGVQAVRIDYTPGIREFRKVYQKSFSQFIQHFIARKLNQVGVFDRKKRQRVHEHMARAVERIRLSEEAPNLSTKQSHLRQSEREVNAITKIVGVRGHVIKLFLARAVKQFQKQWSPGKRPEEMSFDALSQRLERRGRIATVAIKGRSPKEKELLKEKMKKKFEKIDQNKSLTALEKEIEKGKLKRKIPVINTLRELQIFSTPLRQKVLGAEYKSVEAIIKYARGEISSEDYLRIQMNVQLTIRRLLGDSSDYYFGKRA